MKQDFVEWLQEGILNGFISIFTAEQIYVALYDDFIEGDFSSLDCEVGDEKLQRVL